MKNILEIILLCEHYLRDKKIPRARREAEDLIALVLEVKRLDLYLQFDRPLNEEELEKCRGVLQRRGKREPLQYISGEVPFSSLHLKVSPAVLIPRPETEILVEKIAKELEERASLEGKVLLDMCTGSGCIGLSLKKRFPDLTVFLSDISRDALTVAKENAQANDCAVHMLEGDLFTPFEGQKCDFFVCNPPYISEKEFEHLQPEVKLYEPKKALIGGHTGLEFYRKIAEDLPRFLKQGGKGWLEIGTGQGDQIKSLFEKMGWKQCLVEKDWAGHDRFFSLERDSSIQVS